MNFSVMPPEVNSLQIFAGVGSQPMLAASAAWDGLAGELTSAASGFRSVTTTLAGQAWQGPAATAMSSAAVPYAGWLNFAASRATGAAEQAKAVANVFEETRSAMVHPSDVAANRYALVRLVVSNMFGQNAALIAAVEGIYEEFWAQDVAAMAGYYSAASASASALLSWREGLSDLPQLGQVGSAVAGGG